MKIEGRLHEEKGWYSTEVPMLLVYTQGKTPAEAFAMTKDAIETLVDRAGFEVTVTPCDATTFAVEANDPATLLAFVLRQQRGLCKLTVRQVAARLGSKNPSSYAQYERGTIRPSFETFTRLLGAIDPHLAPMLKVVRTE
ncbi:MAG: hypothetical protein A2284_18555 [Deltaproteobacteria bacterium RIFOXYA12_FULL_61_11]|nr:MAG: hypothetical protein A2284_18555 [Deltaproteobacteria bacterium RIFOXYA12_FULL_61_11]